MAAQRLGVAYRFDALIKQAVVVQVHAPPGHYRIDEAYFQNRFDQEPWLFTWLRQQQDGDFWR